MATVDVLVKPRSKRDRVTVGPDGGVAVAVTSPPVDGRANDHVVRLIAGLVGVPRSAVSVVRGRSGKRKTVAVDGVGRDEVLSRLARPGRTRKGQGA